MIKGNGCGTCGKERCVKCEQLRKKRQRQEKLAHWGVFALMFFMGLGVLLLLFLLSAIFSLNYANLLAGGAFGLAWYRTWYDELWPCKK